MQVLDPEIPAPIERETVLSPGEVKEKGSYGQILKSSALVGGSSLLNVVVGMVRTKVLAVLLGPAGFGLFGVYNSIVNLVQTFAGMGVNSSGVRQIAEAAGTTDDMRVARTAIVLRRVSLLLGLLGALVLLVFSRQIAEVTFGNRLHASSVSLLAVVVFFMLISAGQSALIQGLRRIADLAKISVIGAVAGTVVSIPLVYFLHDRGVVPALIAVAAMTFLTSWWYSRRVHVPTVAISNVDVRREIGGLLKLGFAFMSSGIMTIGVAYVVRTTVLRKVGMEATGLYQSAWTLGGLYVAFILQAMGADFYPRLTACARENAKCNRLVNEQVEVGLLLAGPGVLATLTCAPLAITLFYSARFMAAVPILRWICLGTLLQVVTWPIGFIIVAKARQVIFFFCELAWALVSLALAWFCVGAFGLTGAGIAFAGSYVFHGVLIYAVVRRVSGYRWSPANLKMGLVFAVLTAVAFGSFYVLPFYAAVACGGVACCLSAVYSVHTLLTMFSMERLPPSVQRILSMLSHATAVARGEGMSAHAVMSPKASAIELSVSPIDVSIIIVNWKSKNYVRQCLRTIALDACHTSYEVWVVDNASDDGCGEMMREEFPAAHSIESRENIGFAKANNLAFSQSTGRKILFLNPDTEIRDAAIHRLSAALDALPDAGMVGARLLNSDLSLQTTCVTALPSILNQTLNSQYLRTRFPSWSIWGMRPLFQQTPAPVAVEAISGACMMARREVVEEIGGFTTDFFMYSEDMDLCMKVAKTGKKIYYVPDATIVHHAGGSSSQRKESAFSSIATRESLIHYLELHRGHIYAQLYRVTTVLACTIRLMLLAFALPIALSPRGYARLSRAGRKWLSILLWSLGLNRWARQQPVGESS